MDDGSRIKFDENVEKKREEIKKKLKNKKINKKK